MFRILFIHELQKYFYSLRFHIALVITLVIFAISSVVHVSNFKEQQENYRQYTLKYQAELEERAQNATVLAITPQDFTFSTRENSIISDCKESFLPNTIQYSAYRIFGFYVRQNSENPLLGRYESLSWNFIVTMFLSFITLLFAFDTISGEKEERTISLVFSNAVPRRMYYITKLLTIVSVVFLLEIIGLILSLIILTVMSVIPLTWLFFSDILGFLCVSLLIIFVFASFGIFSSVISRFSNVSLLTCLCFWLLVVVIIPNTSIFWAKHFFPISTREQIFQKKMTEEVEIRKEYQTREGSFFGYDTPFDPRHALRVNWQGRIFDSRNRLDEAYYKEMFYQFEKTRNLNLISPVAQFDYIVEGILGGGYLRFQKNWNDLHIFQHQFLEWFKNFDMADSDSPHWYNPSMDISTTRKPVELSHVPQYQEAITTFRERINFVVSYIAVMLFTIAFFSLFGFFIFVRYNVC